MGYDARMSVAYNAASEFIDRHVQEGRGARIAIRDDKGEYDYAELAKRTARAGHALRSCGLDLEQRVLLCMLDSIDFVATFFGAIKIGAVAVPVNTLLTTNDYAHFLRDSRARVLVVSDALYPKLEPALGASPFLKKVLVAKSPLGGPDGGHEHLAARMAGQHETLDPAPTSADDVAFWLYSSGSTGAPKGAMHLQSSLGHTARLFGQGILGIRPDDIVFSAAKLFFAYGLGNAMSFPLSVGATAVLMAERPTPASVFRTLDQHQPSIFYAVPTLFAAILADPGLADARGSNALRFSVSAGEALPRHVGERWRARFGTDILDGIGSTEMLHMFLSNKPGDVRYGTTGRPVPGYDVALRGDDGQPVADGEEGALWVRGPSAAIGYWNNRERSLSTFQGPWTRTGDTYIRESNGYYIYVGRSDDMLKVGGQWVSPFEVESALGAHDAVLEAAVVGHTDDDGLTKPKAFVVLKPGKTADVKELQAFVKERLAPFKYPRWIEFLAELPKTATGKIQRFKLRKG
jgi:benzoate-CoA ligase family protein